MKKKIILSTGMGIAIFLGFAGFISASQSEYEKSLPEIAWWTASDYEDWILEQKTELEALVGTGDGWFDAQGAYHQWTQETVNATIAQYEEILSDIKAGVLYAKPNEDGMNCTQFFPDIEVSSVYSADFVNNDGNTIHIGDYSTKKELQDALDDAVKNGKITQEEADAINFE